LVLYGPPLAVTEINPAESFPIRVAQHDRTIRLAEASRDRGNRRLEAMTAEAAMAVTHAQATLDRARAIQQEGSAALEARIEAERTRRAGIGDQMTAFRQRVGLGKVRSFGPKECYEVLQILGVTTVPLALLVAEQVTGEVLLDLAESEMRETLQMPRFGDRRRLKLALRRLANGQGFPAPRDGQAGAFGWGDAEAAQWLTDEGFGGLAPDFAAQGIDGACLLDLTVEDLKKLGVEPLGVRSRLNRRLHALKKQTYAGGVSPAVASAAGAAGGSGGGAGAAAAAVPMADVLAAVLKENQDLQTQITQAQAHYKNRADIPPQFLCPILHEVMVDPVMAADGYTYEREAIETWYRQRDTSPMTNQIIPPTLIPNIGVKQQIADLD
jgi:hypothetical protein